MAEILGIGATHYPPGMVPEEFKPWPLARMLQGGSWAAGRKIAASLRADGGPPLRVISDGTVF